MFISVLYGNMSLSMTTLSLSCSTVGWTFYLCVNDMSHCLPFWVIYCTIIANLFAIISVIYSFISYINYCFVPWFVSHLNSQRYTPMLISVSCYFLSHQLPFYCIWSYALIQIQLSFQCQVFLLRYTIHSIHCSFILPLYGFFSRFLFDCYSKLTCCFVHPPEPSRFLSIQLFHA